MTLKKYKEKRKFGKTPEPEGQTQKKSQNRFVVQKHNASTLHYDFRLELPEKASGGKIVLKSWAVPKGIPQKKGVKRLAIATEDHPVSYLTFEGIIPEGQYGAGKVEIWDKGNFELLKRKEALLEIKMKGGKLNGTYVLIQPKSFEKKNWLTFKK